MSKQITKDEQISKGKAFRKAVNKLERDKKGRFLPRHKCVHFEDASKNLEEGVKKAFAYGNPNGSGLLSEISREAVKEFDDRVSSCIDVGDIGRPPKFILWLGLIIISSLVGVLLGLLMIKVL